MDLQMVNTSQAQHQWIEGHAERKVNQEERMLKKKQLLATSSGWSKRVRGKEMSTGAEDKDQYMNCMRDLYKVELVENRKQNRIRHNKETNCQENG
jgi:hypothetical protein